MCRRLFILLLLVMPTAGAGAQTYEVWVGRPTVGDYMRRDIAELMKAQQETTKAKAQMNAEIAEARKRFLATAADPSARAKVGETFAKLLWAKDLIYATFFIQDGFSDETIIRMQGMNAMTGGPLDRGIYAEAWGAFRAWVNGIRASLGATKSAPRVWLLPGEVEKFRKALEANEGLYAKYMEQRDLAEIQAPIKEKARIAEMVRQAKLIEGAQAADGSARLHKEEAKAFGSMDWEPYLGATNMELRKALREVQKGGQQSLMCTYGPLADSSGQAGYSNFEYWYRSPPGGMEGLLALVSRMKGAYGKRMLRIFLGRAALDTCPQSLKAAEAVSEAAVATATAGGNAPAATRPGPSGAAKSTDAGRSRARTDPVCESLAKRLAEARAGAATERAIVALERSYDRRCGAG